LTPGEEEVLEPDLEITDAHHHLWDDRAPVYALDELVADIAASGHHITRTVFVQCGWDRAKHQPADAPVAEVHRVLEASDESLKRGSAVISGIVGFADLRHGNAITAQLDELVAAGGPRLAGVRHATVWDLSVPLVHWSEPTEGMLGDQRFRGGARCLAPRGLTFDASLYHTQLFELEDFARAIPELPIVLNHLGWPLCVAAYEGREPEVTARWRDGMAAVSRCPNVFLKVGGIGMPKMAAEGLRDIHEPTSHQVARYWGERIRWCIELFGVDRRMFESNFPVDKQTIPYRTLWNAFKRIVAGATAREKEALFRGTVNRLYSLDRAWDAVESGSAQVAIGIKGN